MREGQLQEISAQEIVLGDILVLKPGSYVTADARLIEAKRLSIDESALTGESLPVAKNTHALTQDNVPLGDRTNMVYMGTLVTGGQGLGVVVATGKYTEMGKIQSLVGEAELPETPMQKQLDQAGNQLVLISSAFCTVVFGIGLLRGYGWLEMLKTSISLAVAAVPEGLPAVATTTLAIGIAQMRQHHVLIRRLDAVETLGSIQTICMDKTGTITANKMSVVELYSDTTRLKVVDGQLQVGEERINPYTRDELLKLIHVLALCNESEINGNGNSNGKGSEYVVRGSSTENALIDLAIASGVDVNELREKYPLQKIEHRSETRNYMTTFHTARETQELIAVKGNPTEVLALCGWYIKDGQTLPLTDTEKLAIEIENERMAGNGLRVLGAAYRLDEPLNGAKTRRNTTKKASTASAETNGRPTLIWLGLVGMADPIRKGVKDLMGSFHQAGIDTVMITGDQSPTAYAIGKELNLSQNQPLEILDSTRLTNIDPGAMKTLCDRVHVFARISPAHKLQIVQSLQSEGKVVAMTGDGINDAPALKAADVGVAMGHTGTDVAREVGDVVLENDNLETMIVAVSQGRTIYNNIRKSVHFLLSTNLSEIVVMLTATALGIGQPLNAMQLLWLNLVTDIFPGLALALEPPEPDVLSMPPRHPDEPIIQTSKFQRIVLESVTISASALAAYGYGILQYGIGPQASTIGFMSLTIAQLLHAYSCRSEKHSIFGGQPLPPNQYLNFAVAGSLGLQLLAAAPPLRGLLQLAPIDLVDVAAIGGSALLPLLVNEGTKELWTIQLQQDDENPIPQPPDATGEHPQLPPTSVSTEGKS
jgi:Ca2+-transporting ATPase